MFRFRLRHPRLFIAAFAILAAAAVMIFLLPSGGDSRPDYPYPVQTFNDQGREHLPPGQTYDFYNSNLSNRKLVLVVPYAGLEHRIALTAWRTLDTLNQFDEERVQAFIDAYDRKFNPEGF